MLNSVHQIKSMRNMNIKANKSLREGQQRVNENTIEVIFDKRKGHLHFNIF